MTTAAAGTELNHEERYRFDVDGYLVVEDVLSDDEVARLNELVDDQELPPPSREPGGTRRFGDFLTWGQPFCDLLDHPRLVPHLRELVGADLRLDHYYGIYLEAGAEVLPLHGGGTPYDHAESFQYHGGRMVNGLTVVAWNLTDTGPERGGFCCIPGSHKANYECPASVREGVADAECLDDLPDEVVVPEVPAGSAVVFTEALTHGTAPWVADEQRRSLLYKYSPGHLSWSAEYAEAPDGVPLTDRQERLFEPPYVQGRDPVFDEGA
ncbi:MAG: phytanoyl-CoA dioxygenase family protein [Halobacteriaceae archaeon]